MKNFDLLGTAATVGELIDMLEKLDREHKITNGAAVGEWSDDSAVNSVSVFEAHNLD